MLFLLSCIEYDILEKFIPLEDTASEDSAVIEPIPPLDCSVALRTSTTIEQDPNCTSEEYNIENPWNVEIEWQWKGLIDEPFINQVMVAPIVGNLNDDDGDGLVTELDTPDIVIVAFDTRDGPAGDEGALVDARLITLDGKDGTIHWMKEGLYWKGGPVIADVDHDGAVEIVAINQDKHPIAFDGATGEIEWISPVPLTNTYPHTTVADLFADGSPEVIADNAVIDGKTGDLVWQTTLPSLFIGRMPAVGDINLDGRQEIIIGNRCLDANGNELWRSSIEGDYGHWAAILNADGDNFGEVAMVGSGYLALYDHDGSEIRKVSAGTNQPGPPCVADFDGDGDAEIAWASSSIFNMFELDGSIRWSASINDSSGLASCSGYDVDGDGAYEVLFADENQFYIFDGAQGSVLFSQSGHASGTIFEFPIVADMDNDGSAEIAISSNNFRQSNPNGWAGVTVFGHVGEGWAKSGPTWNVHDFAVTNIYPDGSVPTTPEPPWLKHNVYRARPTQDAQAIDLFSSISDICYAECRPEGIVRVSAELYNQGFDSIRAEIPLSLYRKDGNSLSFLASTITKERIEAGEMGASVEFETNYGAIEGADALVARADDWGSGVGLVDECDEWNNGIEFTPPPCE
jgi:hypothetical protein